MSCVASKCFDKLKKKCPSVFSEYTITQVTSGGFDVATGNITNTSVSEKSSGIFENYTERQLADNSLQTTDIKLADKTANLSLTPRVGDVVTKNSIKYDINQIKIDPTSTIYEMNLRRRGSD